MADTICIWTPQGLKCSASPIKSHGPGTSACVPGDPNARHKVKSRHGATKQLLAADLGCLDQDNPWPGAPPSGGDAKQARLIARVVELLYAADVKEGEPFTIAGMPGPAAEAESAD